jgi:pyrimidine-nucleoside phosphorylase
MNIPALIEKKRDGHALTESELRILVDGFTRGEIPDYQMAAMNMAVLFRGMNFDETMWLTRAMMDSGRQLDLSGFRQAGRPIVDKHSTGGVGDKVSLVLGPLAAACGLIVPMISGRGLGITGGTLDKLESIPGLSTQIPMRQFVEILDSVGCAIVSQTADMVPADKKLYALRDVTGTVPSIPLIVSSIMSKKMVEDLDGLVLDVKWGNGAFMRTQEQARELARQMVEVGKRMGKRVVAYLTDMNQPLGRAAGNALEVAEAIETLKGDGPDDLRELTITLTAEMLVIAGVAPSLDVAHKVIVEKIESKEALRTFEAMIEAQGGDARVTSCDLCLPRANHSEPVRAPADGYVQTIDCYRVGLAAVALGAGRETLGAKIDPAVGFTELRKTGERVRKGEPLAIMHFNDKPRADTARALIWEAYRIGQEPVSPPKLMLGRVESSPSSGV